MDRLDRLDVRQAQRAITIDFEGNAGRAPTLLGHAADGHWGATITEELFATAVGRPNPYGPITADSLDGALDMVRRRAIDEDRVVVAWSEHEISMIQLHLTDQSGRLWWEQNLVNGLVIARRWRRAHDVDIAPIGRAPRINHNPLSSYLSAIGYRVPASMGPGNTGQRIASTRRSLESGRTFDSLTPTQKGKWTRMLGHNLHDCLGLHALMTHIAEEEA